MEAAAGVKVTEMAQELPAAREPQLLVWLKALALVPLRATPLTRSVVVPELVSVTPIAVAVVPAGVPGNVTARDDSVATGPVMVDPPPLPEALDVVPPLPQPATRIAPERTAASHVFLPMIQSPISRFDQT
jgi:hypothetical protein